MRNLRLLYDPQVFAGQVYGGVSRIFYELIQHLASKEGIAVNLCQGFYVNRFPLAGLKKQAASYWGHRIPPFPHASALLKPVNQIVFSFFTAGKTVDVYHPTNYSGAVAHWRKSPVVVTVCDMIPELFPANFKDIKARLVRKKTCIQRADCIIAISRQTANDLLSHYPEVESKTRVIYPGAPLPRLEWRTYQPYRRHRPYLLYVGTRIQGYKNFSGLLAAYSTSTVLNNEFDLLCFGGPPFCEEEQRRMTKLGCRDKIHHITGGDDILAALYRGAAVFVYPSLYEGFGLPLLEAMAYRCPVATARISCIPEVAADAVAYFNPHDPDSIATTLESLLGNTTFRQEQVTRGEDRLKDFSWPRMAEETLAIYRQLQRL